MALKQACTQMIPRSPFNLLGGDTNSCSRLLLSKGPSYYRIHPALPATIGPSNASPVDWIHKFREERGGDGWFFFITSSFHWRKEKKLHFKHFDSCTLDPCVCRRNSSSYSHVTGALASIFPFIICFWKGKFLGQIHTSERRSLVINWDVANPLVMKATSSLGQAKLFVSRAGAHLSIEGDSTSVPLHQNPSTSPASRMIFLNLAKSLLFLSSLLHCSH